MTGTDQKERMVELDELTCRQLLGSHHIGRIAFNAEPSPEVLPVNYVLHDDGILFHTGAGAKQIAADRHQSATFQVDGSHEDRQSGWSVMVHGVLETMDAAQAPADLSTPWPGGERPYLVCLSIHAMTGRQIPPEHGWVVPTQAWQGQDASDLMG